MTKNILYREMAAFVTWNNLEAYKTLAEAIEASNGTGKTIYVLPKDEEEDGRKPDEQQP